MYDTYFIKMALALAARGRGYTSPNPMVGAVVVQNGNVVGKGWHHAAGKPHAEVNAIDDAGPLAKNAALYVTLEPCNHHGRTPPCTEKILNAGIKKVVVAMEDPNPDVKGGGNAYLREKGIDVISGICEAEAKKLNESFIKYSRTRRPFVILKCAATLDGRIAAKTGDAKWISGETSRKYVHQLRHDVDAIMVGANTVKIDDPRLTTRLDGKNAKDPIRIILDTRLSIPKDAGVLRLNSDSDTYMITGKSVPAEKTAGFKQKGVKLIEVEEKNGLIDLNFLMDKLGGLGITSLLIEGGSRVLAGALAEKIVDKVLFFYCPKILGGDDGIPICKGPGPELMKDSIKLSDISVKRFDDDIMIEGYIKH